MKTKLNVEGRVQCIGCQPESSRQSGSPLVKTHLKVAREIEAKR